MIDKEQISNFLRINDIPSSSPHNEIREALLSAGWDSEDIEVALLKLQGENHPYKHDFDDPSNLFHTSSPISQNTLTSLLGVDVSIPRARMRADAHRKQSADTVSATLILMTVFTSVILASFVTLFIMYLYNVGPFYSPVENYIF